MTNMEVNELKFNMDTYEIADKTSRERIGTLFSEIEELDTSVDSLDKKVDTLEHSNLNVVLATTASNFTDTANYTKILVPVTTIGSYTGGHWYYRNGSTWTDGGTYGGTFSLDSTLTDSGKAANAKAVGDRLDEVEDFVEYAEDMIADEFSTENTYEVGDCCIYNYTLYRCKVPVTVAGSWNVSNWQQIKVMGEVSDLKNALDVVAPETELSWTMGKSINGNGVITDASYSALTGFVRKCGNVLIVRKAPQKDANNNALAFWVSQFNDSAFISRDNLPYYGDSITLDPTCTWYAIGFARAATTGIVMQQTDIDTYFDADIYSEVTALQYGNIPTSTTKLSDITEPGCYNLNLANYAALTDLPSDFDIARRSILVCLQKENGVINQWLQQYASGYLWTRGISLSDPDTYIWSEGQDPRRLVYVTDGDADKISWTGWYGWGSTEDVSNVPAGFRAGMLLNVARNATTKYQLAMDYSSDAICARRNRNGIWGDWKTLLYRDDIPYGKGMWIQHETGDFGDGTSPERLRIYVSAETGYILYMLQHFVNESNNTDCWQIYNAYQVDDSFDYSNKKTLTASGEWECAIHLSGREDFSGGHTHGDEIMQSVVFLMDGDPVTISDYTALTTCKELRVIRTSTMYDPDDRTRAIAKHGVEYVFSPEGVTIDQSLEWLVEESLTPCYMCMFTPSKNYIDRAAANSDFVTEVLPSETGVPLETVTKPKSTGVTMWDTGSGMFATVDVPVYPTGLPGGDKMTIHDNSNHDYNKVYFYVCNSGRSSVGELWKAKSIYRIGYKATS